MAPTFSRTQRALLLIAFALILVFRLPETWVHGRFQDEEASVFLAYAWHHSWAEALFRSFAGYLNLAANAVTLAVARLVQGGVLSLEHASYATMLTALAFQVLPIALLLNGKAPWLTSRIAMITALLLIALMPAIEEVYFNVMHIQFHLALCAALILALEQPETRKGRAVYVAILLLAPLCGPGAIVLLPLFALRTMMDRSRWWQLAALGIGAAIQLALFYHSSPVRGNWSAPQTVAAVMSMRFLVAPLAGADLGERMAIALISSPSREMIIWLLAGVGLIAMGTLACVAAKRRDSAFWLVGAGLMISLVTFGIGFVSANPNDPFSPTAGSRYNYIPAVLFSLALVAIASRRGRGWRISAALCALLLVAGAGHYRSPIAQFAHGPDWSREASLWQSDHSHPLAVWPSPFTADLSDQSRPCSKPQPPYTRSTDPRYCESGWLAFYYGRRN